MQPETIAAMDAQRPVATPVWVAYVRRGVDAPWRLEALSVLGPDRARALAERQHARARVLGAEFRIRQYDSLHDAPERLESQLALAGSRW